MDLVSSVTANRICGNEDGEAVLECTLHGTEMLFNETTTFALTGGGSKATVNGIPITFNRLIKAVAGSVLKLHPDPQGCRSYLACAGGLSVPKELGSASTYVPARLGGQSGRNLEAGDLVQIKKPLQENENGKGIVIHEHGFGTASWKASLFPMPHVKETVLLSCKTGPEWDWFDATMQSQFLEQTYKIGSRSDRMGYRLEGSVLTLKEKKELVSTAVTRGIVQLTHEGLPIVLMADAQTIGGYPRIARLSNASMAFLAQCRPGMALKFVAEAT